jgi:hypothetical protein
MPLPRQSVDDQALTAYLLGELPSEQTEQFDELSVADDDVAARLERVETDLVDAYVRGELSNATREKFEKAYLSSPLRRQRLAFAQQFQQHLPRQVVAARPEKASWWQMFRLPQFALAGALAMLVVVGLLWQRSLHPRQGPSVATVQPPVATPATVAPKSPEAPSQAQPAPSIPVSVIAFVLAPQLRDASQPPRLELPPATTRVDVRLELEGNDFPRYRVSLKTLKQDKALWQSAPVAPVTKGQTSTLSVRVPAKVFASGMNQFELTGIPATGEAEFAGNYVFKVVAR